MTSIQISDPALQSVAAIDPPRTDGALYRKVSLRIIPFLFICYVISFLDRINIGFAQLQMKQDLGFSDAMYGLGAAVFYIGYVLCEVPSNLLLERFGARKTFTRIMVLWGVASVGMMLVSAPDSFLCDALHARCIRGGIFPRHRAVSDLLVSFGAAGRSDFRLLRRRRRGRRLGRPDLGLDHARHGRCIRHTRLAMDVCHRRRAGNSAGAGGIFLSGRPAPPRQAGSTAKKSGGSPIICKRSAPRRGRYAPFAWGGADESARVLVRLYLLLSDLRVAHLEFLDAADDSRFRRKGYCVDQFVYGDSECNRRNRRDPDCPPFGSQGGAPQTFRAMRSGRRTGAGTVDAAPGKPGRDPRHTVGGCRSDLFRTADFLGGPDHLSIGKIIGCGHRDDQQHRHYQWHCQPLGHRHNKNAYRKYGQRTLCIKHLTGNERDCPDGRGTRQTSVKHP